MPSINQQFQDFYDSEVQVQQNQINILLNRSSQSERNQIIGRPRNQITIRNLFAKLVGTSHYFHVYAKSLIEVLYKLESPDTDNYGNEQFSNVMHRELLLNIIQFVQNKALFLQTLYQLTRNNFPSIQQMLNIKFEEKNLQEMPIRTLGYGLRATRLIQDPQLKKENIIELGQTTLKCLYIGTILLVGVGQVQLNLQSISQNINSKFQKIVLNLIKKSKLLNSTTFTYIREHWDSIIELVINGKIQMQQTMTEEDNDHMKQFIKFSCQKSNEEKTSKIVNLKKDALQDKIQRSSLSDDFQDYQIFIQEQYDEYFGLNASYSQDKDINALFSQQFSFRSSQRQSYSNQNSHSKDRKQKNSKDQNKNSSQQEASQNCSDFELQRQKRLIKRAKQVFNFEKEKRKRKPSKKDQQKKKSKKTKKQKKPHPQHKMRQIDRLIKLFIKEQFCIAYAIANHISNALDVENMRLKLY